MTEPETPWWEDPDRPRAEYEESAEAEAKSVKPRRRVPVVRWSTTPTTWAECLDRLAYALGGRSERYEAEAEEWVAQAVDACWGVRSLFDITRSRRQLALQRTVGTVLWLEDQGELAFRFDLRDVVRQAFARYWKGAVLAGPAWRIASREPLPTWESLASGDGDLEWMSNSDTMTTQRNGEGHPHAVPLAVTDPPQQRNEAAF